MKKQIAIVVCALSVSNCASVPDVEYRYYATKSTTTVSLTRTVQCNPERTQFVFLDSAAATTTYSSDRSKSYGIKIKDIEGSFRAFADSEMAINFYEDGRLKSINQSTTGQGEAVIKAVAGVVTTFAPFVLLAAEKPQKSMAAQCIDIALRGPITISYSTKADFAAKAGQVLPLTVARASKELAGLLPSLPDLTASLDTFRDDGSGAISHEAEDDPRFVKLYLQKIGIVDVAIKQKGADEPVWQTSVAIPGKESYALPIPKSALFGKQAFSLSLAESGAITSISFGKTAGSATATNSVGSIGTILGTVHPSAATRANAIKAESDLIKEQTRLILCQQRPVDCK